MLRFGAGPVGEPDDREARQPAFDVRLDLDPPGLEPDKGVSDRAREHSFDTTDRPVTGVSRIRAGCVPTLERDQAGIRRREAAGVEVERSQVIVEIDVQPIA